ncbi:MAG: hypothetical protein ACPGQL_02265 [Thermoplasmatota archaeon]
MADRRVSYWFWWLLLLGSLFTGAGLLLSPDAGRRWIGLGLLLLPLVVFGAVALAFYLKQRAVASRSDADHGNGDGAS